MFKESEAIQIMRDLKALFARMDIDFKVTREEHEPDEYVIFIDRFLEISKGENRALRLTEWIHIPATYLDPPDAEENSIGEFKDIPAIVGKIVQMQAELLLGEIYMEREEMELNEGEK